MPTQQAWGNLSSSGITTWAGGLERERGVRGYLKAYKSEMNRFELFLLQHTLLSRVIQENIPELIEDLPVGSGRLPSDHEATQCWL